MTTAETDSGLQLRCTELPVKRLSYILKQNYKSFAQKFESPTAYAHTWGDMWLTAFLSYLKAETRIRKL